MCLYLLPLAFEETHSLIFEVIWLNWPPIEPSWEHLEPVAGRERFQFFVNDFLHFGAHRCEATSNLGEMAIHYRWQRHPLPGSSKWDWRLLTRKARRNALSMLWTSVSLSNSSLTLLYVPWRSSFEPSPGFLDAAVVVVSPPSLALFVTVVVSPVCFVCRSFSHFSCCIGIFRKWSREHIGDIHKESHPYAIKETLFITPTINYYL